MGKVGCQSGRGEAFLIATACSDAPEGHDHWALRLLVDRLVELGVVVHEDDGEPVAFGKDGARNPHTGDVVAMILWNHLSFQRFQRLS
jgi:hypothetical protein